MLTETASISAFLILFMIKMDTLIFKDIKRNLYTKKNGKLTRNLILKTITYSYRR